MSEAFNSCLITAAWRARSFLMQRQGWACGECGKISAARRRFCCGCGSETIKQVPLPRRVKLTSICLAGESIETLNQEDNLRLSGLVALNTNSYLVCQVAYSRCSAKVASSLAGRACYLSVRRLSKRLSASAPIPYGLKAVLNEEI